ncbi:MAG TPA: ABC transporter ATP-binding protein [Actinomycetes bacterium]|nr:ABC transporter ATP-binding protein [Actinomycetes bacterium]
MSAAGSAAALATQGLSLSIGGARIVDDITLTVGRGEFLGVIGPNGAGKTTLFNLLSGLITPSLGRVHLAGAEVTRWPPARRARAGLGRTFQTSSVFPALTVLENVRLAAQARMGGSWRFWRRADRLPGAVDAAHEGLAQVGLSELATAPAGTLSHGDKRKLELAILLATDPSVILLDEPMAGMSAADVPELSALIRRVHEQWRATMVMVEHHMDVIVGLADRIAVMHHGALLAVGTPTAVMADDAVQGAYLGEPL